MPGCWPPGLEGAPPLEGACAINATLVNSAGTEHSQIFLICCLEIIRFPPLSIDPSRKYGHACTHFSAGASDASGRGGSCFASRGRDLFCPKRVDLAELD